MSIGIKKTILFKKVFVIFYTLYLQVNIYNTARIIPIYYNTHGAYFMIDAIS